MNPETKRMALMLLNFSIILVVAGTPCILFGHFGEVEVTNIGTFFVGIGAGLGTATVWLTDTLTKK